MRGHGRSRSDTSASISRHKRSVCATEHDVPVLASRTTATLPLPGWKISRGATGRGKCDGGTPAGAEDRRFSAGSLPSPPLTLYPTPLMARTSARGRRSGRRRVSGRRSSRLPAPPESIPVPLRGEPVRTAARPSPPAPQPALPAPASCCRTPAAPPQDAPGHGRRRRSRRRGRPPPAPSTTRHAARPTCATRSPYRATRGRRRTSPVRRRPPPAGREGSPGAARR